MQNGASGNFTLTLQRGDFTYYWNNLKDKAGFIVYFLHCCQILWIEEKQLPFCPCS